MKSLLAHLLRSLAAAVVIIFTFAVIPADGQMIRRDGLLPVAPDTGLEPFGLAAGPAPAGPMWIRWREFEQGVEQSAQALARCRETPSTCSAAETHLLALVSLARNAGGRAKFGLVNREINLSIAYTSDVVQHGTGDVWSSAVATFTSGQGDCEDFAIAKYVTLREAGVPAADLRVLVGRVASSGGAHAVLAARQDGHWLILDNRRMAMIDDAHAVDLQPLFAFDSAGVKEFGGRMIAVAAAPQEIPVAAARPNDAGQNGHPVSITDASVRGDALPLLI